MTTYVLDTNLYVGAFRDRATNEALISFVDTHRTLVYQHSAISQELLAGARDGTSLRELYQDWVEPYEAVGRIITPSHSSWVRAARIIAGLVERRALTRGDIPRGFLNDCLIAASARETGFTIVTNNLRDFQRIATVEPKLRFCPPWP